MSRRSNIPKRQEYGENDDPLTRIHVEELLKEDHESRRPRRCAKNVPISVVCTILMAGIGYLIFDNYRLRKTITLSLNHTTPCPTFIPPSCPACHTPTQAPCPSPIPQTCPTPAPCPSPIPQTCPTPAPCPGAINPPTLPTLAPCPKTEWLDNLTTVKTSLRTGTTYILREKKNRGDTYVSLCNCWS